MSTLKVNNITDSTGLVAPIFPPGSAQLNPMAGREDRIINGDFAIWQRGVPSSSASGYVGPDRWINSILGGTVTQSLQSFTMGDTLGSNCGFYYLRQTVSGQTLPTHYGITSHRVEFVQSYAGQTITVLGWARRASGNGNMAVEAEQGFGAGGSPSATVWGISPTIVPLTSSWAPFAVVINVPSITGKVLGTTDFGFFGLNFWSSGGSSYNSRTNSLGLQTIGVDLWGIHIRMGAWTSATTSDYRLRAYADEIHLCQRYYEALHVGFMGCATGPGGLSGTYGNFYPKRTTPVATVISVSESVNLSTATMNVWSPTAYRYYGSSGAAGNMYASAIWSFAAEI